MRAGDAAVVAEHVIVAAVAEELREAVNLALAPAAIRFALNAGELMERAAARATGLVLLDIDAIEFGGLDCITRLRETMGETFVPIIALGGEPSVEVSIRCRLAGAVDQVERPIDARALKAAVATWLASSAGTTSAAKTPLELLAQRYLDNLAPLSALLIEMMADETDFAGRLRAKAHSLAGTAGTLGFTGVSAAAFAVEAAAERDMDRQVTRPSPALREAVEQLRGAIDGARGL